MFYYTFHHSNTTYKSVICVFVCDRSTTERRPTMASTTGYSSSTATVRKTTTLQNKLCSDRLVVIKVLWSWHCKVYLMLASEERSLVSSGVHRHDGKRECSWKYSQWEPYKTVILEATVSSLKALSGSFCSYNNLTNYHFITRKVFFNEICSFCEIMRRFCDITT